MNHRINRRDFLRFGAAGCAATLTTVMGMNACRSNSPPPNIVFFLADDLGYGDLGCYGNPINKTPSLDRFAAEGVRLTDCHSAGTVCSPSRASLLTGRHPYRSGFYYILGGGAHLREEEITISALLKGSGYDTCFAGKWHLTRFDRPATGQKGPDAYGFDHWFATAVNAFDGPENPGKFYRNGKAVGQTDGWYCDLIVEEAERWLAGRTKPENPFFLFLSSHEPHTPIAPPERFSDLYDREAVSELEKSINYGRVPRREDKNISANKTEYYGTVSQLDAAFGRLMQTLERLGLSDNTLVVFTSDNGPEYPVNFLESNGQWDDPIRDNCFGTPGPLRGMKRFTYEGGHRVPGLVRWPGKTEAGSVSDSLVNGTDFFPTFCRLAGIPLPDGLKIDGEDIRAALGRGTFKRRKAVAWNFPVHEYNFVPPMALRSGTHVLIAHFRKKEKEQLWMDWLKTTVPERYELYDITEDPGQSRDLAESQPDTVRRLTAELSVIWADLQSDMPVWPGWKAK